jgi:twitching motility protein PilT
VSSTSAPAALPIDALFDAMCRIGASDLHLSTGMPPLVRKDGVVQALDPDVGPFGADHLVALLDPIMPPKNKHEFAERHDTDFAY